MKITTRKGIEFNRFYTFDEHRRITVHIEQQTSFVIVKKTENRWFVKIEFADSSQAARKLSAFSNMKFADCSRMDRLASVDVANYRAFRKWFNVYFFMFNFYAAT